MMLDVASYEDSLAAIGAEIDRRGIDGFILREEASFVMVTPLRKDQTGQQSLRIEVGDLGTLVSRWRSTSDEPDSSTWASRLRALGRDLDERHAERPVIKLQTTGGYASFRPGGALPVRLNLRFDRA